MTKQDKFRDCLKEIGRGLSLPHLKLDVSGECKLNYNNELDIQLIWNRANSLQLHSRIGSTSSIDDPSSAYELLLSMNHSDTEMSGGYFSLDKNDRSISYNTVIPLIEVDKNLIMNILTNFIHFSLNLQAKIRSELSTTQSQQTDRGSSSRGSSNPDLARLLSARRV